MNNGYFAVDMNGYNPRTSVPIRKGVSIPIFVSSPKNDHILWLQHRSAPPKRSRR